MPKPSDEIKKLIRELEEPFGRQNRAAGTNRKPEKGESDDYRATNFDATEKGGQLPPRAKKIGTLPKTKTEGRRHKYLWIINDDGLFMQLEATPNPKAERGVICHTNLTAGAKAYQGGELWFHEDGTVYINYESGRYGAATKEHRQGVVQYFEEVGYTVTTMAALKEDDA